MIEIVRSNDPVELSWTRSVLAEHGVECILLDAYMSVVEGSIGAIPRRLMVTDEDEPRARALLAEARAQLGSDPVQPG
jgi:hypothetical protein